MELFEHQWATYRRVVDHDLMEHRALSGATAAAIETWLAARPKNAAGPHLVDLGCGDLALLAPLLRRLTLGSFLGVDLSAGVLPRAEASLGAVPYPCRWRQEDLLAWAEAEEADEEPWSAPVDLLHSAFAVHHLSDDEKARFLHGCRRRLSSGGCFLWADVFRQPGESREDYVTRYVERIQSGWDCLESHQRSLVIDHLSSHDMPADAASIRQTAEACGWQWRWLWRGQHRAEALALLTPAS